MFGLFQGGIVPAYALIVREYFSPAEAGARVGTVLMATLFGMALGGWMSGAIFDLSGSYQAAFVHGIAWNRSEEHTSELQSLMRISYAVFCLKKKKNDTLLKLQTNSTYEISLDYTYNDVIKSINTQQHHINTVTASSITILSPLCNRQITHDVYTTHRHTNTFISDL